MRSLRGRRARGNRTGKRKEEPGNTGTRSPRAAPASPPQTSGKLLLKSVRHLAFTLRYLYIKCLEPYHVTFLPAYSRVLDLQSYSCSGSRIFFTMRVWLDILDPDFASLKKWGKFFLAFSWVFSCLFLFVA